MLIDDTVLVALFDHDDTLVGTRGPKVQQHILVAQVCYGKTLTEAEILAHWGKPLPQFLCAIFGTDDADRALENSRVYSERFPKTLFPDTIPTLQRLLDLGKWLGIVTASTHRSLNYDLESLSIPGEWFEYIQAAEDTTVHKPNPRVFDPAVAALHEQGLYPEEVLYVGDGLHDLYAARGAGFSFIGVETGLVSAEEFREHGAISVPTLADLVR